MARPRFKSDRAKNAAPRLKRRKAEPKVDTPKTVEAVAPPRTPVAKRDGHRLPETTGMVLDVAGDRDYALLDSGLSPDGQGGMTGEKLERYGALTIRRPEGQAVWHRTLPDADWNRADATFTGDDADEGRADRGRWAFRAEPIETFPMAFDHLPYLGRFTAFRHTGVFPEQAVHWRSMAGIIARAERPVRVLNLFGYTGLASLVAAKAGAEVTHVDASKKAIQQARENGDVAGLNDAPIRWICDDALKFCEREVRRGNTYDIILLDPPAYGRGPKGETWHLFDDLPHMLDTVRDLQSEKPLMTVLTAYAIRASHFAIHEAMQDAFAGMDGRLESGELVLVQENGGRRLSTSMFTRFLADGVSL